MTTEDLKEIAAIARINLEEGDLARLLPAFTELTGLLDTMQAADDDKAAFPEGLVPASAALPQAYGNYRTVDSRFFQSASDDASPNLAESLLGNAGERDGRFLVVPNVL